MTGTCVRSRRPAERNRLPKGKKSADTLPVLSAEGPHGSDQRSLFDSLVTQEQLSSYLEEHSPKSCCDALLDMRGPKASRKKADRDSETDATAFRGALARLNMWVEIALPEERSGSLVGTQTLDPLRAPCIRLLETFEMLCGTYVTRHPHCGTSGPNNTTAVRGGAHGGTSVSQQELELPGSLARLLQALKGVVGTPGCRAEVMALGEKLFQHACDMFLDQRLHYVAPFMICLLSRLSSRQSVAGGTPQHATSLPGSNVQRLSAADMGRLLKYRETLPFLELDDAASELLKRRLIDACGAPEVYWNDNGQRFLSFVLSSLSASLSASGMRAMRGMLPSLRSGSASLKAVSHVLYTGWRLSDGETRLTLERELEEWVELAILCEPKVAVKFREALYGFYKKGDTASAEFVCRSFPPLLYRYIPVACWKVRFNATALFAVVFPLVDVSLPTAEYEADVERQYSTLVKLTEDSHPEVRRVAVQGVCRVLVSYWEMVPVEKTTLLLDALLTKAVRDRTSAAVRAAVLDGLVLVLDNPMSHQALMTLLPRVSDCIHDVSPSVRKSTAALLKRVSEIRDFVPVTAIVPLNSLLSRLVKDKLLGGLERLAPDAKAAKQNWRSPEASDVQQTVVLLSDLMHDSVLGTEVLPKQVERVMLMAEKFPLALLTIIEVTAGRVAKIDRVRLAVALFNFGMRKLDEAKFTEELPDFSADVELVARSRKYSTMGKVLMQVTRLLLESLELMNGGVAAEGAKKRASRVTKPKKRKVVKPSKEADMDEGLRSFLEQNFNEATLKPLLKEGYPAWADALELARSLVTGLIPEDYWLSLYVVEFFLNEDFLGFSKSVDAQTSSRTLDAHMRLLVQLSPVPKLTVIETLCCQPLQTVLRNLTYLVSLDNPNSTRLSGDEGITLAEEPMLVAPKKARKKEKRMTKTPITVAAKDTERSEEVPKTRVAPRSKSGTFFWSPSQDVSLEKCLMLMQKALSVPQYGSLFLGPETLVPDTLLGDVLNSAYTFLTRSPLLVLEWLSTFLGTSEDATAIQCIGEEDLRLFLKRLPELLETLLAVLVQRSMTRREDSPQATSTLDAWCTLLYGAVPSQMEAWTRMLCTRDAHKRFADLLLGCFLNVVHRNLKTAAVWSVSALGCYQPKPTERTQLLTKYVHLVTAAGPSSLDVQSSESPGESQQDMSKVSGVVVLTRILDCLVLWTKLGCFSNEEFAEVFEALVFEIPSDVDSDTACKFLLDKAFTQKLFSLSPHAFRECKERWDARLTKAMNNDSSDFYRQRVISSLLEKLAALQSSDTTEAVSPDVPLNI